MFTKFVKFRGGSAFLSNSTAAQNENNWNAMLFRKALNLCRFDWTSIIVD